MNRRGSLFDLIYLTIAAVALVIGIILIYYVGNQIHAGLPTDLLNGGPNGAASDPFIAFGNLNSNLDALVVFFVIAGGIGSAILARQVNENPAYWLVGIIFIACMNVVWMAMHDALVQFLSSPQLAATANHFPFITILVTYLPLWFLILSIIIAWATWGKPQNQYWYN